MGERLNMWMLSGISFLLFPGPLAGQTVQNVALRGPAVQSSEHAGANADRAVDGNRDPGDRDTCTFARSGTGPWWRVDLRREYLIDGVAITSADSSQETLDGIGIWIGNSGSQAKKKDVRCAVISSFPRKQTLYVPCRGFRGRYVTVLLPFPDRALSLCEVEVYPDRFGYPLPNVALKGEAAQSSTLSFSGASKAIDGRRDSLYTSGSCSHTAGAEADPWWRLDLRRAFVVMSVKVTNRGDCCAERLDGAEIRIGNGLENNGNSNPRCAVITRIRAGKTSTFRCTGGVMAGRFVNIVIPGPRKTLTLCEVEVYGTPEEAPLQNVALNKAAKWSLEAQYRPSAALGGCRNVASFECCESGVKTDYWRVVLSAVYKVRAVTIISTEEHVKGTNIIIRNPGSHLEKYKCVRGSPQHRSLTHTFHCDDIAGRFVEVRFPSDSGSLGSIADTLTVTLCELEVYASAVKNPEPAESPAPTVAPPAPPSESMELNGRTVTVVGERLCWSDALLHCRRHHSDLLSLRSQEELTEVARLLERVPFQITDGVWLGLRKYIMGETWFWMSGQSMEFTHWPPHFVPHQESAPCGSMDVDELHRWADRSCDQHLHFVCQSGDGIGLERVPFHSYV